MLLLLLFLVALPLFFILFPKHLRNVVKTQSLSPPGPKGLPLIGNLHQFDASPTYVNFFKLSKTYGPLVFLRLGFLPTLVISSAKLAKEVLKTQDHIFCSRAPSTSMKKLSYNELDVAFTPYGEYWREMRKIVVIHLLSSKKVQSFSCVRKEEVSRIMGEISTLISVSKIINLTELMISLSSSIICRIGFGKRYDDHSRFHDILHETEAMLTSFFFSDYFPFMGWVDKIRGASRRLQKVFMELDDFYKELIDEHLDPERKKSDQEDIIDVLLGFDLTLDHIKAILTNIFVAGTDTSAATVVWAMTELLKNPNTMRKVQEEVRKFIGEQKGRTFVQEEDLDHLIYLKAVLKETFRLHPAAPLMIPHQSLQKCTLQGYQIEPGTVVFINAWAIGRDPDSWQDPEKFMPERFVGSSIDFKGQDFKLIPFGAGRRGCPGMLLGVATIELALANLLCWFDWELPDGMKREDIDMDVLPGITVHKKNALCLSARNFLGLSEKCPLPIC